MLYRVHRHIEVSGKGDAITIDKMYLLMENLVALGEHFVPLLRKVQLFGQFPLVSRIQIHNAISFL